MKIYIVESRPAAPVERKGPGPPPALLLALGAALGAALTFAGLDPARRSPATEGPRPGAVAPPQELAPPATPLHPPAPPLSPGRPSNPPPREE